MNSTSRVIVQQLENEGVFLSRKWGIDFVDFGSGPGAQVLGSSCTIEVAVSDAIFHSIRIISLLSKLRTSLGLSDQGELCDLLVNDDEKV